MLWAVVVPDGLAYALTPVILVGIFSLFAYIFRMNARSNEALARTAQELKDIGRRVNRLEDSVFPVGNRRRDDH